jgi:hypothetical protein
MLALLHTANVHVDTFAALARELDASIPIQHAVRTDLLDETLKAGSITDVVRRATQDAIGVVVEKGATVVVCTCSTLGAVAEACRVPAGVRVLRIDRPMAERAVASGRRILVFAALESSFGPTTALLDEVAVRTRCSATIVRVWCEHAWSLFERGDHSAYHRQIACSIERTATATDVVVLAQGSMAPAAELLGHLPCARFEQPENGSRCGHVGVSQG